MLSKVFVIIAVIFLISCTKSIEVEIEHTPKTVINCIIINNIDIDLSVYKSKPLHDSTTFELICDVKGSLSAMNYENAIIGDSCAYLLEDSISNQIVSIQLKLELENDIFISTTNTISKPQVSADIIDINFIESTTNFFFNEMGEIESTTSNRYLINSTVTSEDGDLVDKYVGFSMFYEVENENSRKAISDFDGTAYYRNNNFLSEISAISEDRFSSNTVNLISYIQIPDSITSMGVTVSTFYLENNLHQYLTTANNHIIAIGDPFSSPVIPFSNIDYGGLGIFGAYSFTNEKFVVEIPE